MDVPQALLSAPLACPSFFGPTGSVGANPFVRFNIFQTRRTYQAACSDATPFDLCGGLLPAIPLDQQWLLHAARQQVESDHLGTNGYKWAGGLS